MSAAGRHAATVTLPTSDQIVIARDFAAPALLVWRALTEPELVRRWWHANRGQITTCEIDLRIGGSWRYAMRPFNSDPFAFFGEFLEIVPNEKIVQTETFEPFPEAVATIAMTLTEQGGITRLRTLVQHSTPEARDMHLNAGMEAGMQDAYELLEQTAASLG